jgi:hypothetical protein
MGDWLEGSHVPTVVDSIRLRGHRGGVIAMHRALHHFRLDLVRLFSSISLLILLTIAWILVLPLVCRYWHRVFGLGLRLLPFDAKLESATYKLGFIRLAVPCLRMEPVLPSLMLWTVSCASVLLILVSTFLLPSKWLPFAYLIRAIVAVQASALVYFALWPASFPHTPDGYIEGLVIAELALIAVIPLLFGLTYYIFDFGLLKKAGLTALTMMHLTVFVPCQILLQALVLQQSVLFMPVLYIIFGIPLDIVLIVAFYSWGMTWGFCSPRRTT